MTTEERPALQAITRSERERAINVFGNVAPGHAQDEAIAEVERIGSMLPAPYALVLGDASVAFRDSMRGLLFALALGILVSYMVLGSQFNSFVHPLTVLVPAMWRRMGFKPPTPPDGEHRERAET